MEQKFDTRTYIWCFLQHRLDMTLLFLSAIDINFSILLQSVAHVEAVIDFGEDENIEEGLLPQGKLDLPSLCALTGIVFTVVRGRVGQLLKDVTAHLNDGRRGERLRSGVHVTIVGAPNAGKSSLLNILCKFKINLCSIQSLLAFLITFVGQRPAAIVSPLAGTTRDVLESALDIHGYPIVVRCCTFGDILEIRFLIMSLNCAVILQD